MQIRSFCPWSHGLLRGIGNRKRPNFGGDDDGGNQNASKGNQWLHFIG